MSCLYNQKAGGEDYDKIRVDEKWCASGNLSDKLVQLFKQKAQTYELDWKWLAALAWVESNWRIDVQNSLGYYGLFQFLDKNLNDGVKSGEKRYSLKSPEDQTEVAAKNMKKRREFAKKKGMGEEDSYLYAGMAHNCGSAGAQFLLEKSSPKTVYQMTRIERVLPASMFTYKFMSSTAKRKEISEYPYKMKSAYESICKKYAS